MWLKHDQDNSVIFYEWCRRFDKNEHRNQFVKRGHFNEDGVSKNMNSQGSTKRLYNFGVIEFVKQNKMF